MSEDSGEFVYMNFLDSFVPDDLNADVFDEPLPLTYEELTVVKNPDRIQPKTGRNLVRVTYTKAQTEVLETEFQKQQSSQMDMKAYLECLKFTDNFAALQKGTGLTPKQIRQHLNNRKLRPPIVAGQARPRGHKPKLGRRPTPA